MLHSAFPGLVRARHQNGLLAIAGHSKKIGERGVGSQPRQGTTGATSLRVVWSDVAI